MPGASSCSLLAEGRALALSDNRFELLLIPAVVVVTVTSEGLVVAVDDCGCGIEVEVKEAD